MMLYFIHYDNRILERTTEYVFGRDVNYLRMTRYLWSYYNGELLRNFSFTKWSTDLSPFQIGLWRVNKRTFKIRS